MWSRSGEYEYEINIYNWWTKRNTSMWQIASKDSQQQIKKGKCYAIEISCRDIKNVKFHRISKYVMSVGLTSVDCICRCKCSHKLLLFLKVCVLRWEQSGIYMTDCEEKDVSYLCIRTIIPFYRFIFQNELQ